MRQPDELKYMFEALGGAPEVWKVLQHQFSVLHQRTQTIFALGGLTITVTGFSGHRIVAAGPWSAIPLVLGLIFVLIALFLALYGVYKIRFISQFRAEDVESSFAMVLNARDQKTRIFNFALSLLLVGLTLYVFGMSYYLLRASLAPGSLPA